MANRFLKGLAIVAGTGIAMGVSSGRARSRVVRYRSAPPADPTFSPSAGPLPATDPGDEFLDIGPLLDRLERVEARFDTIGQRPSPSHPLPSGSAGDQAALLADLDRRVEENTRELALLRERVTDAERRVTESVASLEQKVFETREEIPVFAERSVTARFDDLQGRFRAEIEQSHQRTLATFERAIDEKIASRIGSIEKALAEQAGSIEVLRVRATETDNNLQRLVTAIEKLCERAQLIAPAPEPPQAPIQRPPFETRQPFESQLQDAMRREPVVPVLRTEEPVEVEVPAPSFTGPEPKKSRFLFRNLIVAGFSLLASRFVR